MWDLHGPSSDIQQVHIQKCWNTDSSQSRWFGSFVTCNIWFKHCAAEFIHSDTITDLFCIFFNNSKLTLRFTWSFDGNMMNVWQFNNWIIARYWSYLMFYTERNIQMENFFMPVSFHQKEIISWKSPSYTCFVLSVDERSWLTLGEV